MRTLVLIFSCSLLALCCSALSPRHPPVVQCGDLSASLCASAAIAATVAVDSSRGSPVLVELARGTQCPTPGLLFQGTTCPAAGQAPADGGTWIGSEIVSFSDSDERAYLNIETLGNVLTARLIAFAIPPSPSSTT